MPLVLDPVSLNLPVVDVSPPKTGAASNTQGNMEFDDFERLISLVSK